MSDANFFWNADTGTPKLSQAELDLRERFCKEYVHDYDEVSACMRIGYHKSFAIEYAKKFMEEAYVQKRIKELEIEPVLDPREEEELTRRRVRAQLLKEATYCGPGSSHSARVNALAKLAVIHDMDAPKKIQADILNRGGVMAVPGIASMEDWTRVAAESQKELSKAADV